MMKTNLKVGSYFYKEDGLAFDDILSARDELFESRLADGLKAHRKFLESLPR